MKKISTLFKKNPENLGLVIDEIDPQNMWVLERDVVATQKFDGTACAIFNGELYKRYDAKKGKVAPWGQSLAKNLMKLQAITHIGLSVTEINQRINTSLRDLMACLHGKEYTEPMSYVDLRLMATQSNYQPTCY